MSAEQQRLVILSILRDDPRRDPQLSDLDAALDRILAQREEIVRLEAEAQALRQRLALNIKVWNALARTEPRAPNFRVIRGGAA